MGRPVQEVPLRWRRRGRRGRRDDGRVRGAARRRREGGGEEDRGPEPGLLSGNYDGGGGIGVRG